MTTYAYESVDDANAEIGRLIAELADVRQANRALLAQLDEANTDRVRLKNAANKQDDEVCQIIGKALGYPEYEGGGGVCVVPHVGPTIAAEIVDKLADMTARKDGWRGVALYWRGEFRLYAGSRISYEYVNAHILFGSRSRRIVRAARRKLAGEAP